MINNVIVLIDRMKFEIEENGLEPAQTIVEAGQHRLRPISLTTLTTMGGLVPLWLGSGAMFSAMAILFGLLSAPVIMLALCR